MRRSALTLAMLVVLSACTTIVPPDLRLVTRDEPSGAAWCSGIELGTLRLGGDATAEVGRQTWVDSERGRFWIVWPEGWTATFTPELRVFDASGTLTLVEGESFEAGGSIGTDESVGFCTINGRSVR